MKANTVCPGSQPAPISLLPLFQGQPLLDERALEAKLGGSSSKNHSRRCHSPTPPPPPQMMLGLCQCHRD